MGLFNRKTTKSAAFKTTQPLGKLPKDYTLKIELCDDHLIFYDLFLVKKKDPITLKYSQITDLEKISADVSTTQNKSVVGQAVAGKLLFGDVGAQIGAIDATKPRVKKETRRYMVIHYVSKAGNTESLTFEFADPFCHDIYWNLRDICSLSEKPQESSDIKEL